MQSTLAPRKIEIFVVGTCSNALLRCQILADVFLFLAKLVQFDKDQGQIAGGRFFLSLVSIYKLLLEEKWPGIHCNH